MMTLRTKLLYAIVFVSIALGLELAIEATMFSRQKIDQIVFNRCIDVHPIFFPARWLCESREYALLPSRALDCKSLWRASSDSFAKIDECIAGPAGRVHMSYQ
jgi:hypothetical protein